MKQNVNLDDVERELGRASSSGNFRTPQYPRQAVLVACCALLILLFGATTLVSRLYHDKIQSLARDWSSKGDAAFRFGKLAAALIDYRNALVYSPNDATFQLHLAQALAADGHLDEAESYFLNLLAESPGNGEINLGLARIAVRKGQNVEAMRYYQSAIYGVWESDPLARRWNVRRELSEYLLNIGDVADAQPEIIGLAQEVPAGDLHRQKIAGAFLLRASLWDRASAEFDSVLKFHPQDPDAIAGAATALFQLGRYSDALAYFDRLSASRKTQPQISGMMVRSRAIVFADPWAPDLSAAESARRTSVALRQADSHLEDCAHQHGEAVTEVSGISDLQKIYAANTVRQWSELNLTRHHERIDLAMSLVFKMEDAAVQLCGEPASGPDRALRIIEQSRERRGQ
jgi:tetratricopeptide (TPR) repeat protein